MKSSQNEVLERKATLCPHCLTSATLYKLKPEVQLQREETPAPGEPITWSIATRFCPVCERPIISVTESIQQRDATLPRKLSVRTVYPLSHGRPPIPNEVPDPYRGDYSEACAVLPLSAQASAALSRRALQALLRGPGAISPKNNLFQEIEGAETKLPDYLSDLLHTLREIGNFAAHPMKDQITGAVVPVEDEEAEFTLGVIESLFEHYFVGPARAATRKAAVNQKLTKVGKKPLK